MRNNLNPEVFTNYAADLSAADFEYNSVLKIARLQALTASGCHGLNGTGVYSHRFACTKYKGDFLATDYFISHISKIDQKLKAATGRSGATASVVYDDEGAALQFLIPLKNSQTLGLRDILYSPQADGLSLPLCIGEQPNGSPLILDLARCPHLLITGVTGSGKSVCLNDILLSILNYQTRKTVKLILIDTKKVELTLYKKLNMLKDYKIITKEDAAAYSLNSAVAEMEKRYKKLAFRRKRSFDECPGLFPRLVIAVDEFANLAEGEHKKEIKDALITIAEKGRAAGIHLILCTQSPRASFVTPKLKANIPCRISFRAVSVAESKIALDRKGAEQLTGNGDGLYLSPDTLEPVRFQCAYVSDEEVKRAVKSAWYV